MSSASIFQISNNTGKTSELLHCHETLDQRIQNHTSWARTTEDKAKAFSTIKKAFLEETHAVPFETGYKPHISYGSEYVTVGASSTYNKTTGGEVAFSLPVAGDFISDSCIQTQVGALTSQAGVLPALPIDIDTMPRDVAGFTQQTVTLPDGTSILIVDPTLHNFKTVTYKYLDTLTGEYLVPDSITSTQQIFTTTQQDFVRWCDYPGEKAFTEVKFDINGNPLDSYTTDAMVVNRQMFMSDEKKMAYDTMVGQQHEKKYHCPSDGSRRHLGVFCDGLLTPKLQHDQTYFITPILFWFSKCMKNSIISSAIPFGQRYIRAFLSPIASLCAKSARFKKITTVTTHTFLPSALPGNAFLLVPGTGYIIPNGVLPVAPAVGVYDYWEQAYSVSVQEFSEDAFTNGQIVYPEYLNCQILNNNIYTTSNIHNIYIARITYLMIKKFICFTKIVPPAAGQVSLNFSDLKFPTEYFTYGIKFVPTQTDDLWNMSDWHKYTYTTRSEDVRKDWLSMSRYKQLFHSGDLTGFDTVEDALTSAVGAPQGGVWVPSADYLPEGKDPCDIHQYADESQYVLTSQLRAQLIDIIKPQILRFFNGYVPWLKKGYVLGTSDKGIQFMSFTESPGFYQPEGHFDASRAREMELIMQISQLPQTGTLSCVANVINFLLITGGNALLRFAA